MRCISVFLLAAAAAFAQNNFTTGQAARAVIGQATFTDQSPNSSDTVLGGAGGVAYANDTLFVADANRVQAAPVNHRVLLFKNLSGQLPVPNAQLAYNRKCPVCVGTATLVLGQPDMTTTTENDPATSNDLRSPTAVASDGIHLVVADTDHNRVLIWNSIPVINDQPADVVVGQPNFTSSSIPGDTPNAHSLRSPQGVWILNGRLYIADTGYNRVLIYNHIPTTNGASADVALGVPNLTTFVQPDLTQQTTSASASNLLNPVSVTSDGTHLFVTDLGYNRVLIWNSIPTTSGAPADVVIGQPDMNSSVANNSYTGMAAASSTDTTNKETGVLCTSGGSDAAGNPAYPPLCNATLSFPRFALSDGHRLFLADGGNDRVLIFQQIPTKNGASADFVIGQLGGQIDQATDAADSLDTPMSLAWDGTNLFVADPFNRRVTVYSIGANNIPYSGIRNAAALKIYSLGSVAITGTATVNNAVAITIGNTASNTGTNCGSTSAASTTTSTTATTTGAANAPVGCGNTYLYTVLSSDTLLDIVNGLVAAINAGSGDPNALAFADFATTTVVLTAKTEGVDGNSVTYVTSISTSATEVLTAAGSTLTGGGDASQIGPGTLVSVLGSGLSAAPVSGVSADLSQNTLPTTLAGTQVYINGIAAPLLYVSPVQINLQLPWELIGTTSVNAYVRSVMSDGSLMVTTPIAVTVVIQNPGIFTQAGYTQDPKPGVVLHGSNSANGAVLVDGTINAGDVATITIENRTYNYTVQSTDSLQSVRDALVAAVNQDPKVYAVAGVAFAVNFQIFARIPGPDGNGIAFNATSSNPKGSASLVMTATNTALCCANFAGSLVTPDNPAVPGEILLVYATGLGLPIVDANSQPLIVTGQKYPASGPVTQPVNFVSSLAGGKTANVLSAGLLPGSTGVFLVVIQLNSSMPTDYLTQLYIAQDVYISNIVTIPVVSP
jgi:uncharacterized protein (TIGR03437 family)